MEMSEEIRKMRREEGFRVLEERTGLKMKRREGNGREEEGSGLRGA